MKIKLFERLERGGGVETDVNAWLAENPNITVRDIQVSTQIVETNRGVPDIAIVCVLLYDET